jgi:hypothetical protein
MEATAASAAVAASTTAIAASAATIATRCTAAGITTRAAGIAVTAVAVSAAIAIAAAIAVSATAPVVPGSDADEDAAVEPVRAVIAVRGAGVRVIGVVAPLAIRGTVIGGIADCRANADTDRDLGIRRYSGERKNHKRCQHN